MSELRQALELAIKALGNSTPRPREGDDDYAEQGFCEHFAVLSVLQDELTKLKASLPDPVAWMDREGDIYRMPEIKNWAPPHTLLYTAPPQREWQGLTDEEIEDEWERITGHSIFGGNKADGRAMYLAPDEVTEFTRAIEAKLKEKNA